MKRLTKIRLYFLIIRKRAIGQAVNKLIDIRVIGGIHFGHGTRPDQSTFEQQSNSVGNFPQAVHIVGNCYRTGP